MLSHCKTAELLHAIHQGEQLALRVLWDQWAGKVQFFARTQLAPCGAEAEMLAQEVTSDVFFALWKAPLAFDGRVAFSTWLYALARNKSIDCLRKRQSLVKTEWGGGSEEYLRFEDQALGPEDRLVAIQQMDIVLRCVQCLRNPMQREALYLWAWEGMTLIEIAGMQNCSENTVKTRLFHGRKNLRSCLQRQLSDLKFRGS